MDLCLAELMTFLVAGAKTKQKHARAIALAVASCPSQ